MASSSNTNQQHYPTLIPDWIPEGFVVVVGPDNHRYIVPECIGPAIVQQFNAEEKRVDLETFRHPLIVSIYIFSHLLHGCACMPACRVLRFNCMPVGDRVNVLKAKLSIHSLNHHPAFSFTRHAVNIYYICIHIRHTL